MNGQMKKYKESLKNTPEPIPLKKCPQVKIDMSGMIKYAKEKGTQPYYLSEEEKQYFIKKDESD